VRTDRRRSSTGPGRTGSRRAMGERGRSAIPRPASRGNTGRPDSKGPQRGGGYAPSAAHLESQPRRGVRFRRARADVSHAALAVVIILGAVAFGLSSRSPGRQAVTAALVLAALAVAVHVAELLLA